MVIIYSIESTCVTNTDSMAVHKEGIMKKINLMILTKRFYLFFLLFFTAFFMNVFLWNETRQLVQEFPRLMMLKSNTSDDIYDISYVPPSYDSGLIKDYDPDSKKNIDNFLLESFYDAEGKTKIYLGKEEYLNSSKENKKSLLTPISETQLKNKLMLEFFDSVFFSDMIIFDLKPDELEAIKKKAKELNFEIYIDTLRESFQDEWNYYFGNFIFGLVSSFIFMSFSLFIIYLIITSGLKIFQQEIRLLRIVGLSKIKIERNFNILLIFPIIVIFPLFFLFVQSIDMLITPIDFAYLLVMNLFLVLFSHLLINKKIRRKMNANS